MKEYQCDIWFQGLGEVGWISGHVGQCTCILLRLIFLKAPVGCSKLSVCGRLILDLVHLLEMYSFLFLHIEFLNSLPLQLKVANKKLLNVWTCQLNCSWLPLNAHCLSEMILWLSSFEDISFFKVTPSLRINWWKHLWRITRLQPHWWTCLHILYLQTIIIRVVTFIQEVCLVCYWDWPDFVYNRVEIYFSLGCACMCSVFVGTTSCF